MLSIAAILFAVAALGGATLAYLHFNQKERPWALTIVHGLLAATGLVLLLIAFFGAETAGMLTVSLVLFVVAALGGFFLIAQRLRGTTLPSPVVLIHGVAALAAFVALLLVIL